ncbi:hypothetical protein VTN31DRAFT_254 [Thermomyces dupontii]|uniref:uncharacterized protein n=1 Tax=Talaromyces thermophilus TaxID=28565 RepID=UPI0037430F45
MTENRRLPNHEDTQRRLEYLKKQIAEKDKQLKEIAEARKRREEAQKRAEEEIRPTTFEELLQYSHALWSRQLLVGTRAESTWGPIAARREKLCPEELCHWSDFPKEMAIIFDDVCRFLKLADKAAPRLFHSVSLLTWLSKDVVAEPLRSEAELDMYEYMAVVKPVTDIIRELSKFDDARVPFRLPNNVRFQRNCGGALEKEEEAGTWPDWYCFHRTDGNDECPLTTSVLKPPHKLDVQCLRAGLRDMNFVEKVVTKDTIPADKDGKTKSTAETRTGAILAEAYNVMIEEGVEFSYISSGFAYVFLHVPKNEFWKLYYFICEPNVDVHQKSDEIEIEKTSIARVLCFCLMCCRSTVRDQMWRNEAKKRLRTWGEHLDSMLAKISNADPPQTPSGSDHQSSESEHLPSLPPSERVAEGHRVTTRSMTNRCRLPEESPPPPPHADSPDDSDDVQAAQGRERGFSQVSSSPTQRASSTRSTRPEQRGQGHQHANRFCTQRCLLGLQQGGRLDDACPNVGIHQQGAGGDQHRIDATQLVQMLKRQLDHDLDHYCTPMSGCGSYGAPFKITCATYGYTIVGKGTTSGLWEEVSREAEIYRVLRKVQGSAVPVFLGAIDMDQTYFLHGAGRIQHMLLMGWGGEKINSVDANSQLSQEISRSKNQLRLCGVVHYDLRLDNMLWNEELGRVLIIDFHLCRIDPRSKAERFRSLKRRSRPGKDEWLKRHCPNAG